jgi:dihydroxyacetone kinase
MLPADDIAKHFVSDPTVLVQTALRSLTLTNPSLSLDVENKVLYRSSKPNCVSVISGGGSGHEPSFSGFVGKGLLTAAVSGTIFASPSASQVRTAISQHVDGSKEGGSGVLVIVMNYTGDVLNFGLAVENAKAQGAETDMVVVGDDAGVGRSQGGKVGRRGLAGTCLVIKVAGALAETGASLEQVAGVARLVADNTVTIGASLSHVHVPGRAKNSHNDDLGEEQVELGMGIHNESGSERMEKDLPNLVKKMLTHMLDTSDKDRSFLEIKEGESCALLINNLGGVSILEMGGITNEVVSQLKNLWGIVPVRILTGSFMTSLNGSGFSISLLRVRDTGLGPKKSMIELLDFPTEAVGWSAAIQPSTWSEKPSKTNGHANLKEEKHAGNLKCK